MTEPADGELVARLREELARKTDEVAILRQVSSRLNATLNLEQIQEIVLHTMHDTFGFSHALILLIDEIAGTLRVTAGRGYAEPPIGVRVEPGVGVIGMVAQRKRMMRVGNLRQHRAYADTIRRETVGAGGALPVGPIPQIPGLPDAESQLAIPLLIGERLIGVFFVESRERRVFTERDETLVALVANLCASAIHNALLYRKEEHRREALEGAVTVAAKEPRRERASKPRGPQGHDVEDLVGSSEATAGMRAYLQKVAASPASTVLITGENGTGKDLVAKILHARSRRAAAPFMNITCSALAENLLESELFGHERGAFTGAHQQKKGLFELADGGSVFLDEIGEMSVTLQAKLLRFLEDKSFKRVGGAQDIRVDVRIIAATNRDLRKMVQAGSFRQDLYYRLRVVPIELPPLRERPADIRDLARLFLSRFCSEFEKDVRGLDEAAARRLEAYPWPGNVRELRNAVERAVLLAEGPALTREDFAALATCEEPAAEVSLPLGGLSFESVERGLVRQAMLRAGGNQAHAAKLLGMPRDWLRYRIKKFGLDTEDT